MRVIFTTILLNLILIPALWLLPAGRILAYTIAGSLDAILYFFYLILFFRRYKTTPDSSKAGLTLPFVLIHFHLVAAFFLLKLSEFLLQNNF